VATSPPRLDSSVGESARRDPVRLLETETVSQALRRLRQEDVGERIIYFYVTDADGKLAGVVPTRRLLLSNPTTPVGDLMVHPALSIRESEPFGAALETLVDKRLLALPVVDGAGRLTGVIDIASFTPSLLNHERRGAAQEAFQMAGVRVEQERSRSAWWVLANRFPWLLCNIASGLAAAFISNLFGDLLASVVALAFFIPLVLTLSESVAMQTVTMSLQSLRAPSSAGREMRVGLLLGLVSGAIVGLAGSAWLGLPALAAVVSASILIAAAIGSALGNFIPRLVHRLKLNPKIASGPAVLALTDVAALACYFGLSALVLR
jgi:magnesium transporter